MVKPGFKYVRTYMFFNIKLDGKFTRRYILVEGRHKMEPPLSMNYSSFVTRESVRQEFPISGLNDLDICACDIGNAYINAPCRGGLWTK